MLNQIKAEVFKLVNSKLFFIIIGIVGLMFFMFYNMIGGEGGFYLGFVTGYVNKIPLVEGFLGFVYEDPNHPMMWEIVYSATTFTSLLWLALLGLVVQFYLKEYQNGTIKLSIAYGCNKLVLFYSKLVVILIFFGVLYYAFTISALFVLSNSIGAAVTSQMLTSLLKLSTLFYASYIVLAIGIMFLCILIQNSVVVSTITIVYMFSMIFLLIATYDRSNPFLLDLYNYCNPMYYLWKASSFWADASIIRNNIIYLIAGSSILSILSYIVLKKREIK